ncbi:alpha/beta fold hydrolase [Actinomycetospora straminea]|uniref:Alpha/beta hydrolase n=1 Tax=Actinomycetospora straminea TaxID=663607 RepID=A0ABP9F2D9_9PSEU|nr:alpha/beta hydrolase [Actinomycetospora straminea]MDD7932844.1 alpha/beta hydrolase [Actinomycetospora straminea]
MATFVLVHGGFTDGSFWGDTAAGLTAAGHRALVAELPSTGRTPEELGGLRDDVAEVRRLVDAADGADGPVILVGHSYGGAVLTELADHPGVARSVYVAAARPPRGASMMDLFGGVAPTWTVAHPSGLAAGTVDDAETTRRIFCAEMTPEQWAPWHAHQMGILSSAAAITEVATAPDPTHPATYVLCERDAALPPPAQEAMAASADRVVRVPTSHWPMYVDRDGFLALLEREAEAAGASRAAGDVLSP